jgi:hypothetical protein
MLLEMIDECLTLCRESVSKQTANSLLPSIIECLEEMRGILNENKEPFQRLGVGLGRLVTDDFAFSESGLGTRLLEIVELWLQRGR